jgi:HemY protein
LLAVSPGGEEGAVALARAAIEAHEWKTAREALADRVSVRPRARLCVLMAEIEEGEFGDKGRAREWMARAVVAPRDPAWVADGFISDEWRPVSPVTGELGAFAWKAPLEGLALMGPVEEAAQPSPPLIEARPVPPQPRPRRSEPLPEPGPPTRKAAAEPPKPAPPTDIEPVIAPSDAAASRQPDDPGADPAPEGGSWARKIAGG